MTQKNERQPRSILEPVIHNERRWELEFIDALRSGQLGVRASALYRGLDAGIGLLTVIASCLLGCKGTDHHLENLLRRLINAVLGALRLGRAGYYDEAAALLRVAAELANLLQLFSINSDVILEWSRQDAGRRRNEFAPVKVRIEIEKAGRSPAYDETAYRTLCETAIHVTPSSAKLSHDLEGEKVFVGPYPSVPGLILVLTEAAYIIAQVLASTNVLFELPDVHRKAADHTRAELLECIGRGEMRMSNYEHALQWFRAQADSEGNETA